MRSFLTCLLFFVSISDMLFSQDLIINEIMYNTGINDLEYIEIYNNSENTIDVQGWYIIDNNDTHEPCLLTGSIASDSYLIITSSISLFQAEYPAVSSINVNDYGLNWAFGNAADIVRLFDNSHLLQDEVAYYDSGDWPSSADGGGFSLELLNPDLDNNIATSWDPANTVGGTPGIQNSVYTLNVFPTCKDGERSIGLPGETDQVIIAVTAFDNEGLEKVELFVNTGSGYLAQLMHDDGINGDQMPGDSIYTSSIPAQNRGSLVKYYAVATDLIGQQDSWPNNVPAEYHAYTVGYQPPNLRITEALAVNNTVNSDGAGEFDDWIEIQNQGSEAVNFGGMFISNSLGSSKSFQLPSVDLDPGEFILIWADNDLAQGPLHADFKLSSAGESVALFDAIDNGNVLISGWKYGLMSPDISMGYISEESSAPEYLMNPTPGAANSSSTLFSDVCINEFQSKSNFGGLDDWIEIYNRGDEPFDLSGCYLSDDRVNNTKWSFPQGTIIQPHQFLTIYEDALLFGFSSAGNEIIMFTAADGITGLDFYNFGMQLPDQSEGRITDGSSVWAFFSDPTPGESNANPLAIEEAPEQIPDGFKMYQNYPNPFNPTTIIGFDIATATNVKIELFNSLGQYIETIHNNFMTAGYHELVLSANDRASGIYYYRIYAEGFVQTKKMLIIK